MEWAFYLQAEAKYTGAWLNNEQNGTETFTEKRNDIFAGLRPGVTFFMSEKFALETGIGTLGYTRSNTKRDRDDDTSSDTFRLSLNTSDFLFGLSYYF